MFAAITQGVEDGLLWLASGPASLLAEPISAGILTNHATLREPPAATAAAEILPANLPDAWTDDQTTAFAVATALSQRFGQVLPWKTVRDVITASLNARFTELDATSEKWPCEYPSAQSVKLRVATSGGGRRSAGGDDDGVRETNVLAVEDELTPSEIQELGDIVPQLLTIRGNLGCPIAFRVRIEVRDGEHVPDATSVTEMNQLLNDLKEGHTVK